MGHDTIRLTGLRLSGRHGVFGFEKEEAQPFVVDLCLELDLSSAGRTDSLTETVSYAELADIAERIITGPSRDLIEALAEDVAGAVLLHDPRIAAVEVTVHKPQAPLTQTFDDVAVTLRRTQADVSTPGRLPRPRPEVTGVYEAELVDEDYTWPRYPSSPEEGETITTPTAHVGYYDRTSLAELGHDEHYRVHLRDPDLPAAFPVKCVLALGSNLGDSLATLDSAVRALDTAEGVTLLNVSPLARTKPVGGPAGQRDFLNQVVEVETKLSPHDLLELALRIESDHNRVREERWGPRTLDVDIVTYSAATIDSPRLQVPHPSAAHRAFVLLPWSWMDPLALLNGRAVRDLAEEAADFEEVTRMSGSGEED